MTFATNPCFIARKILNLQPPGTTTDARCPLGVPTLSFESLIQVIDGVILLGTLGVLVFTLLGGYLRASRFPNTGRNLLMLGVAITVLTHLAGLFLALRYPGSFYLNPSNSVRTVLPHGLLWFLSRLGFTLMVVGAFTAILQRRKITEYVEASDQIAEAAQDRLVQSEARFRQVVESTNNAVFCYTFDPPLAVTEPLEEQFRAMYSAVLTECNRIYAQDLGYETAADVLGSTFGDHNSTEDFENFTRFIEAFIDGGYSLSDYELVYTTRDGEERALSMTLNGNVQNDRLLRVWGAETNILAWRRTQSALMRRRAFQELLARVSSRLVTTKIADAAATVPDCLREICEFVGAERAIIQWVDWDAGTADVRYAFRRTEDELVSPVSMREFPWIGRNLAANRISLIDDVQEPPPGASRDCRGLERIGLRSVVALPLVVSHEVIGLVTFADVERKRFWHNDEVVRDLQVLAELFANYLLRIQTREALDEAMADLRRASERLEAENVYLRKEIELSHGFDEIVGESPAIRRSLHLVERVAATDAPVLALGETGTGKELIARAVHERSNRRDRPLVKVNCAALPASLIESELFGYEKGAFTGADSAKRGRFDLADGSTLFLDEIGEIPLELQPKLLRVLQEGEFERLGGTTTIKVDVRLIAATNRDLPQRVEAGEFRSDLFYRISTFPIELPPLRERGDDVALLAEHFVKLHSQRLDRDVKAISASMMRELRNYTWPGNVRELEGVIQRALIASSAPVLELADPIVPEAEISAKPDLRSVERDHILSVLEATNWRISGKAGAAVRLGVPPSTLRSKMKRLEIARPA